jgi:hypothetical protein
MDFFGVASAKRTSCVRQEPLVDANPVEAVRASRKTPAFVAVLELRQADGAFKKRRHSPNASLRRRRRHRRRPGSVSEDRQGIHQGLVEAARRRTIEGGGRSRSGEALRRGESEEAPQQATGSSGMGPLGVDLQGEDDDDEEEENDEGGDGDAAVGVVGAKAIIGSGDGGRSRDRSMAEKEA